MPNGNIIQDAAPGEGKDGYYKPQFMVEGTMNGSFEASFLEIVDHVEKNYRIKPGKEHRAIAGLSMGGFHTVHISRYYQNTFDYMGVFGAALYPTQVLSHEVYQNMEEGWKRQAKNGFELYWIAIGKGDQMHWGNQEFMKKLDTLDFPYEYTETDGGHTWMNWRRYFSEFVGLIFK